MLKNGEDFLDEIIMDDFREAWTCKFHAFDGTLLYHTVEPANLQAMMATQFKDFATGQRRADMVSCKGLPTRNASLTGISSNP